jgi:AcrR family transcriptional regulator
MAAGSRRTGRRPGAAGDSREQILAAARQEFAEKGFAGATLRSIAQAAGVNIALIAHYFENKDGLFMATIELPAPIREGLREFLACDDDHAAERLARAYLGAWEDPATREPLLATVRSAVSSGQAMHRLRALIFGAIHQDDMPANTKRETRIALAMSHLFGVAIARHIVEVPQIAGIEFNRLVAEVAPVVQLHLDAADS